MDIMQQNINAHKQKLFNLVNQLINTILVYQEININDEIKKESENLKSLLIIKQNNLINQNNINNNINFNLFNFQQNPLMTVPQIYQANNNPINQINVSNENKFFNIFFNHARGTKTTVVCKAEEKVSEMIRRYREKSNDLGNNAFLMDHDIKLDTSSNITVKEMSLKYFVGLDNMVINVSPIGCLRGGFKLVIH